MTVLVGYVPSPEGETALRAGIGEARLRGEELLVVNTSRGDALVDPRFAQEPDLDHVREDLAALGTDAPAPTRNGPHPHPGGAARPDLGSAYLRISDRSTY